MSKKIYKGLIRESEYGEADDIIYLGESDEPLLEELQDDQFEFGNYATVRYFISDKPKTKDQLEENLIRTISGDVEADFGSHYSEYTGYLWTDEEMKIGGHDLMAELHDNVEKYLWLEIEWLKSTPKTEDKL